MRYVDNEMLELPAGWLARAAEAAKRVDAGADPNDDGPVWREVKDGLAALLHQKCWFCETPIDRSDNAVEHFRPKNRVSDAAKPHAGYRWLAFDKSNLRFACTYCNSRRVAQQTSGGKADRFPLVEEDSRVYLPGPIDEESPALLDPCELHDWELLGCREEDGHPTPATNDPAAQSRVAISIEVFHWHYGPTCKRRHGAAVQLLSELRSAKRLFLRLSEDQALRPDFSDSMKRIRRACREDAAYSGEMIFLLKGHRSADHPWVERLLGVL